MDAGNVDIRQYSGVNLKLYCSYGLASWNSETWMFSLGMALGALRGNMQLTAVAAFAASASVLLFSPSVGRWIDKYNRFKVLEMTLLTTNTAVAIAAGLMAVLLLFNSELVDVCNGAIYGILQWLSIVAYTVATLGMVVLKTIISKDWVVVICQADHQRLTDTNAGLLRADLISMVFAPYVVGQLIHWTNIGIGCLLVAGFTMVAFVAEYGLFRFIYKTTPGLSRKSRKISVSDDETTERFLASTKQAELADQSATDSINILTRISSGVLEFVNCWRIYARQQVVLAGVALALLYLTVVGFDSVTDVYAYSQGLSPHYVAMFKGGGALAGVLGSFAYPFLMKRAGLIKCGAIALALELSCLTLSVVSIWLPGSQFDPDAYFFGNSNVTSSPVNLTTTIIDLSIDSDSTNQRKPILLFMVGVVLSRFGLWIADLTINQLFQETVRETERGVVNSVQNAFNSLLDLVKNALVIVLPDPSTFGILVIISWSSVMAGFQCYLLFSRSSASKELSRSFRNRDINMEQDQHSKENAPDF